MFIWSTGSILKAIEKCRPEIYALLQDYAGQIGSDSESAAREKFFADVENVSIDVAVLERAENVIVIRAKMITMDFLTGVMIPFTFFPEWFQSIAARLPFQYIGYVPVTIYLGKREGGALAEALLTQAAWSLVLFLLARWFWNRSVRHVTLQGG